MHEAGKCIYGVIEVDGERNFGPIGIGDRGDEVHTVAFKDLSAVISDSAMVKFEISRENLMAHERVLENIMKEFTVLPVKFGTVAANAEHIRVLLEKNYDELKYALRRLDGRIELGVKAVWKNMDSIFQEVVRENPQIEILKAEIAEQPGASSRNQRIIVGQMVQNALEVKREAEGGELFRALKKPAVDSRFNPTIGDKMLLNAAFLVDRTREGEFDEEMSRLDSALQERIRFVCVGPAPPYNFVNITLHAEM